MAVVRSRKCLSELHVVERQQIRPDDSKNSAVTTTTTTTAIWWLAAEQRDDHISKLLYSEPQFNPARVVVNRINFNVMLFSLQFWKKFTYSPTRKTC